MAARHTEPRRIVVALFPNVQSAGQAVRDLKAAGFQEEQIGLAMREDDDHGTGVSRNPEEADSKTRAAQEARTGAAGGGVLGGLTGLLVATGVVAIPGIGPLLAGGALAGALGVTGASILAGAGVGAAAGGLVGTLIGMNIPDADAAYLERAVRSGQVLVTVDANTRIDDAAGILRRHGGETDIGGAKAGEGGTTLA